MCAEEGVEYCVMEWVSSTAELTSSRAVRADHWKQQQQQQRNERSEGQ